MPTRTDLQVRVLDLLGVTQAGQDPSAEDVQKVDSFITTAVAICKEHRVAIVDPSNIKDGLFEPFATVVANMTAPAFGQQRDDDTIARDKHNLRIAQADEGGAFSRRRREFAGAAQRALAGAQSFAGTDKASIAAAPGFAGTAARSVAAAPGFAGTSQSQLAATGGAAGTAPRPLQGSK